MRLKYLVIIGLLFCKGICAQHKTISRLKDFAMNADLACYEQKIQQDLNRFDKWLVDSLPLLKQRNSRDEYRQGNIDLQKENKIFVLAVTLANTENYTFEDDIYNYLIIDSLRTFICVCVDEKMNVVGITDTETPGTFIDIEDDFYYYPKKRRKQIRTIIKNINKESPDLILYCEEWFGAFLYIKDENIYVYKIKTGESKEFNEDIRKCPDIDIIRHSNKMILPYSKSFGEDSKPLFYRLTGHTPPEEVRMCPPKQSKQNVSCPEMGLQSDN